MNLYDTLKNSFRLACKVLLVGVIIIHAFNLKYIPITSGLDPSWQYIINYSFHHHLKFVFTYGILGFITQPMNIGSNLDIAVAVRLFFWFCFSALFVYLVIKKYFPLLNLLAFALLFSLSSLSFDYFLCFFILFLLSISFFSQKQHIPLYSIVTLLSVFLGLIRFTGAMLAILSCILFMGIMFCVDKRKALQASIILFGGFPLLFSVFYLFYSPSFSAMGAYLRGAYEISSGYNVAMSIRGEMWSVFLALGSIFVYLVFMGFLYKNGEKSVFIAFLCIPSVFITFKHGFTRQLDGREYEFFTFMALFVGLILLFTNLQSHRKWFLFMLIPVIAPLHFFPGHAIRFTGILGAYNLNSMMSLLDYSETQKMLKTLSPDLVEFYTLAQDWLHTIGDRTVSIFPWEASYAPANTLNYLPFPVIQTYSAYTPYLDELNAAFLEDPETAPEFIIMQWYAINNRHVLTDVPAMWLTIYKWYDIEKRTEQPYPSYLLKRRNTPRFKELELIEKREYKRDDFMNIPVENAPVVMKLSMKLSLFGKLMKIFFRVPEVSMNMFTDAAGYRLHRIVPDTLEDGLFINYLPLGLHDVYDVMHHSQMRDQLYGFNLSGKGLPLYEEAISIEFYKIPTLQIRRIQLPELSTLVAESSPTLYKLESVYNYIPDQTVSSGNPPPSLLLVRGWAIDAKAKDSAGGVYIDIDGKLYPAYYGFPREDIAEQFHSPTFRYCGFQAGIPVSEIGSGTHTFSIKILSKDLKAYYSSERKVNFTL